MSIWQLFGWLLVLLVVALCALYCYCLSIISRNIDRFYRRKYRENNEQALLARACLRQKLV